MQNILTLAFVSFVIVLCVVLVSISQYKISLAYTVGIFCKTFILLFFSRFIFSVISSIVEEYSKYKKYTYIDALTNVYNRRKFEETMSEVTGSDSIKRFSLVLFDVDSFKYINDSYGHSAGDYVLKEISYQIEKYLRLAEENGQLFRFGGDEFFLIFRNKKGKEVEMIMKDIIKKISDFEFYYNPYDIKVTLSVGVAEITHGVSKDKAISYVDKNLYRAKAQGKNQVYFK